jgi:hypothetical protein
VFGRGTNGGEPRLILRDVGPKSAEIPEWMTKPAAAALSIHAPPRLPLDCLQALRSALDVILSVAGDELQAAETTQANDAVVRSPSRAIGADTSTRRR